jgi:hypothetical protein
MSNERMTELKSVQREPEREQSIFTFKGTQWIWLFLGILEPIIARGPVVDTTQTTTSERHINP